MKKEMINILYEYFILFGMTGGIFAFSIADLLVFMFFRDITTIFLIVQIFVNGVLFVYAMIRLKKNKSIAGIA